MTFKEKTTAALGTFGSILVFCILHVFPIIPIAMIVVAFELPFWVNFILLFGLFVVPSLCSTAYWIVGLIGALTQPLNVVSIIYYVFFAIVFLPTLLNLISLIRFMCSSKK